MHRLKRIINNRVAIILAHGKSIKGLETKIQDLKKYDICYCSLGVFPVMEKYILNKINKSLDIVFDCASIPKSKLENYENNVRLPRLAEFLERDKDNLWITTQGIIRDSIVGINRGDFTDRFHEKIFILDSLFPRKEIGYWMSVPNSTTLLIASLMSGGARRIILCGYDGYLGEYTTGANSYYHSEYIKEERRILLNSLLDYGINRDTEAFEQKFPNLYKVYCDYFKCNTPIYNCSFNSIYTVLPKIKYNELEQYLI